MAAAFALFSLAPTLVSLRADHPQVRVAVHAVATADLAAVVVRTQHVDAALFDWAQIVVLPAEQVAQEATAWLFPDGMALVATARIRAVVSRWSDPDPVGGQQIPGCADRDQLRDAVRQALTAPPTR